MDCSLKHIKTEDFYENIARDQNKGLIEDIEKKLTTEKK